MQQQISNPTGKSQPHYLVRYLSLAPVLAVLSVSLAFTAWLLINAYFPDLLSLPQ